MDWGLWAAFVVASAVVGLIPGPGVVSIVGYALSSGRRVALASVAGMAIGNTIAISLSLAGVGALLAASALAFALVKWAGAAYLIALGLMTIVRSRPAPDLSAARPVITARFALASTVAVGTFHPKTIIFFVAFVPQFISPERPYLPQAMLLVATFCATVAVTDAVYAVAASSLAHVPRRPRAALWSQRAGGGALIAAGIATATAHR
jgi:threonine/homoserine/homoserine lactone efflux protein